MSENGAKPKIYIPDTSSIIDQPGCIQTLGDKGKHGAGNIVVLTNQVMRELDDHAKSNGVTRVPARTAQRTIDKALDISTIYHSVAEAIHPDAKPTFKNGGKLAWHILREEELTKHKEIYLGGTPIA